MRREIEIQDLSKQECQSERKDLNQQHKYVCPPLYDDSSDKVRELAEKHLELVKQHNKRIEENTTPASNMPDKEQTNCATVENQAMKAHTDIEQSKTLVEPQSDDPLRELHELAKQRYSNGYATNFNPDAITEETLEHAKDLNKRMDLLDNIRPKEESLELVINKNQNYESVSHPKHYNNYDVEVIDMMERIFGPEETAIFCKLNAFKYRMRMGTKPTEAIETDFKKEQWYLEKAKKLKSNQGTEV